MAEHLDVVGSGWHFPLRIDRRGGLALTQDYAEEIEQAIRIIVGTPIGHRLMRPEFGCRIHELLFAPINASTIATAAHYVEEALGYWEPRIDVVDIQAAPHPDMPSCLLITIAYRVRATHDERALVYPFYSIPEED
jgi:phage baseplate assembly protein W